VSHVRSMMALAAAAALGGCAVAAEPSYLGAKGRGAHDRGDGIVTHVTIESRYGHGAVSGPVRKGARNLEVRLPAGSWIDCARNCAETLRRETVDFWENHGRDGQDGPDYLSWRR
jgi:hypothetical protein